MSAIHFEGDRSIPLPLDTVANKLGDVSFLVSCLENIDHVVESSPERAVVKLKTGFSFLSATLEVTITVEERTPTGAKFRAFSKGVGATSVTMAALTYTPAEQQTQVHYTADVTERTGLLKIVSAGLIQSAAKKVIDDTWSSVERKMHA